MIYGNLAYKYDYSENEAIYEEKKQVKKVEKKPQKRRKKKTELSYGGKILSVLTVAAAAVFMIVQYVTVNELQSNLRKAAEQYKFEESVTAQKSFELEQSIDLSKIEAEATSRLGMRRPEKYQTVYLDVKQSDVTIKTADEVEGFSNRAQILWERVKSNIIEFFSI